MRAASAAAALVVLASARGSLVVDPDMDAVLERSRQLFGWPAASEIPATVAAAKGWAASLNATGYWSDINYNDPHDRADWLAYNHVGRVVTMVQALTVPGSPVFDDPALSAKTHLALDAWIFYPGGLRTNDNWWYQVSSPKGGKGGKGNPPKRQWPGGTSFPLSSQSNSHLPRNPSDSHHTSHTTPLPHPTSHTPFLRPPPPSHTPSSIPPPLPLSPQWIGVPLSLSNVFANLGVNRTTPQEQAELTAISYQSAWWVDNYGGSANEVWMITVEILRGAATSNSTALDEGFTTMWANAVVGSAAQNWQGVQVDSSYHFHGEQILNPAYGADWLQSLLNFWQIAQGTRWAMPAAPVSVLAKYIAEGNAEITFAGKWDWITQGRGIDRPGMDFSWGLPTPIIRALAAEPAAAPWQARLLQFADALDGTVVAGAHVSNKFFWTSQFSTHHRPGWGAAFKTRGNNTKWVVTGSECDNSENILGEHLGDGVLNLYTSEETDSASSAFANIFPLLDWQALGGVTAEHNIPIEPCTMGTGDQWKMTYTTMVGGVSDGLYGSSVMDLLTHNTTLQRSVFFLDRAVLLVGTNLSNGFGTPGVPVPSDVWTTLTSRLVPTEAADPTLGTLTVAFSNGTVTSALPDGAHTFAPGSVAWANVGGLGMWPALSADGLPSPSDPARAAPFLLTLETRSANWTVIGPYPGSVTGRILTASLDHGSALPPNPAAGQGYAFLLSPNVTAADMPALNASLAGAACVVARPTVHGVSLADGSVTFAHFWDEAAGGSYGCASTGLTVSSPSAALVLVRRLNATAASVTASHPTRLGGTLQVTVGGVAAAGGDGGCAAAGPGGTGTVFTIPLPTDVDFTGSPTTVTCAA
jgi:hypothetical protein